MVLKKRERKAFLLNVGLMLPEYLQSPVRQALLLYFHFTDWETESWKESNMSGVICVSGPKQAGFGVKL